MGAEPCAAKRVRFQVKNRRRWPVDIASACDPKQTCAISGGRQRSRRAAWSALPSSWRKRLVPTSHSALSHSQMRPKARAGEYYVTGVLCQPFRGRETRGTISLRRACTLLPRVVRGQDE